ncbi:hypothetical protein EV182_002792 [Spiromyces aspiralis]|uniref:Uncharacterized protein n=1 Tax=Spiromyces aspiralis TaxID=68401 RepID=A0ACC1HTJ2_9FUNG|nr:hypothetical protein EV182_002792 [Spiromyces aspiralis]
MAKEESMSLEETNKLRISLGLKPLADSSCDNNGDPITSIREGQEEQNYQEYMAKVNAEKEKKALEVRIQKSREKREANKKLVGKTLGDDDNDGEDDTAQWLKKLGQTRARGAQNKKSTKKESPAPRGQGYSSEQLEGLKVAHDIADIFGQDGTDEHILTLRDRTIEELEQEGDELQSVCLAEQERQRENLRNREQNPQYRGYDDDEFRGVIGQKRSILSHYDEVIDGKKPKTSGFTIGSSGQIKYDATETEADKQKGQSLKQYSLSASLDYLAPIEVSDYYTTEEIGSIFKTKKKKATKKSKKDEGKGEDDKSKGHRRKNGRKKLVDNLTETLEKDTEEDANRMEVDVTHVLKRQETSMNSSNYVDDDDLQLAIFRSRRKAMKGRDTRNMHLAPEAAVARVVDGHKDKINGEVDDNTEEGGEENGGGGLIISDMSEFVQNLGIPSVIEEEEEEEREQQQQQQRGVGIVVNLRQNNDGRMRHVADQQQGGLVERQLTPKIGQKGAGELTKEGRSSEQAFRKDDDTAVEEGGTMGEGENDAEESLLYDEPLVSSSLGSALNLLKKRGWLERPSEEQVRHEKLQQELERRKVAWRKQDMLYRLHKEQEQRQKQKDGDESSSDEEFDKHSSARRRRRGKADPLTAQEIEEERRREIERQDREYFKVQSERLKDYRPDIKLEYTDKSGRVLSTKEAFNEMCYKFHGIEPGKNKRDKMQARLERETKMQQMLSGSATESVGRSLDEAYQKARTSHFVLSSGNGTGLSGVPELKK